MTSYNLLELYGVDFFLPREYISEKGKIHRYVFPLGAMFTFYAFRARSKSGRIIDDFIIYTVGKVSEGNDIEIYSSKGDTALILVRGRGVYLAVKEQHPEFEIIDDTNFHGTLPSGEHYKLKDVASLDKMRHTATVINKIASGAIPGEELTSLRQIGRF